jgi:hypothetical protein
MPRPKLAKTPTVAIAVPTTHERVVRAGLVKDDRQQSFRTSLYSCLGCMTPFVFFFVEGNSKANDGYADALKERIIAECERGQHPSEGHHLARPRMVSAGAK